MCSWLPSCISMLTASGDWEAATGDGGCSALPVAEELTDLGDDVIPVEVAGDGE